MVGCATMTIGISWKAEEPHSQRSVSRPRNLSLFDDTYGRANVSGWPGSSIISEWTSSSLPLSLCAGRVSKRIAVGTINVYLNYRSTAIWDRAYPMQFRRRSLLCVFRNERSCASDDDGDVHRRRLCDINSPLFDNLGQLIPSCSTCVIVQVAR